MKLLEIIIIGDPGRTKSLYRQFVSLVDALVDAKECSVLSQLIDGHGVCHIKSPHRDMDIMITCVAGKNNPTDRNFALRENCTVLFCPSTVDDIGDCVRNIGEIQRKRVEKLPSSKFFNVIPIYNPALKFCSKNRQAFTAIMSGSYSGYCRPYVITPAEVMSAEGCKTVLRQTLAASFYRELINAISDLQALDSMVAIVEAAEYDNDKKKLYTELRRSISDVKKCLTSMQKRHWWQYPDEMIADYYSSDDPSCGVRSNLYMSLKTLEDALEQLELRYDPYWKHVIYNVFYSIGNILALMSGFRTRQAYNCFVQNHQNHGGRFGCFTFFALSHSQQIRADVARVDQQAGEVRNSYSLLRNRI